MCFVFEMFFSESLTNVGQSYATGICIYIMQWCGWWWQRYFFMVHTWCKKTSTI